jgi:hypothetical protein
LRLGKIIQSGAERSNLNGRASDAREHERTDARCDRFARCRWLEQQWGTAGRGRGGFWDAAVGGSADPRTTVHRYMERTGRRESSTRKDREDCRGSGMPKCHTICVPRCPQTSCENRNACTNRLVCNQQIGLFGSIAQSVSWGRGEGPYASVAQAAPVVRRRANSGQM